MLSDQMYNPVGQHQLFPPPFCPCSIPLLIASCELFMLTTKCACTRVQYANEANTTTKNIAALITYVYVACYTVGPLLNSLPPLQVPLDVIVVLLIKVNCSKWFIK